jgi:hypothetical protein
MQRRDKLGKLASLWFETAPPRAPRAPLRHHLDLDVAVLGRASPASPPRRS